MKKLLLTFVLGALILSCKDESGVELANETTFMRYLGSEYNHIGVLAVEAHNGFAILANVQVPTENVNKFNYRIKLIHTNLYGHKEFEVQYPAQDGSDGTGYQASSLLPLSDGYLIIGYYLNENGKKEMHVRKISPTGDEIAAGNFDKKINQVQVDLEGKAISMDASGALYALGSISGDLSITNDMHVSKLTITGATITQDWIREYGSIAGNLLSRLYVNQNSKMYWGGSYLNVDDLDFRLIGAPFNSLTTEVDIFDGSHDVNETAMDFCETLGGFAIVGSRPSASGDENIYFAKVSYTGTPLVKSTLEDFSTLNDRGVSICPGQDGGYMVLATVESGTQRGYGAEDVLLVKVNDVGTQSWSINFGSSDKDEAVSVRQTFDGGYLILGTTTFGSEKKLMLMKVKANGKF